MADKKLKIEQLVLDLENPRIAKAGSQREALQQIITDQDVRLAALGESIITDGLNPMDRLLEPFPFRLARRHRIQQR